jgi:type II secretory pathway predicted ATPase ExeA
VRRRPLLDLFPPSPSRGGTQPPATSSGDAPGGARLRSSTSGAAAIPGRAFTYETFYGLDDNPFRLDVDLKFLYHSSSHDRCAHELLTALKRPDALVLLTGQTGIGKTMMCRSMVAELDRRTLTSFVAEPVVSVEDLLKRILIDFGVMSRSDVTHRHLETATRPELTTALRNFLGSLAFLRASTIVILDQAQELPIEVLSDVRTLIEDIGDGLLQIVLVGNRQLVTHLGRPGLSRLKERLSAHIEVGPLLPDEIPDYVMHRVRVAGAAARIEFSDAAFAELFRLSQGVPRTANAICNRALALGWEDAASVIDEAIIGRAAQELGLVRPVKTGIRILRSILAALVFTLLAVLGARGAFWLYHDRVAAIVNQWASPPPLPPSPTLEQPVPVNPIPLPPQPGER